MDKHMQNEKELIRLRRFMPAAPTTRARSAQFRLRRELPCTRVVQILPAAQTTRTCSPDHRRRMEIESGGTRALGIPSLAWADKMSQTSDRLTSCGFADWQSRSCCSTLHTCRRRRPSPPHHGKKSRGAPNPSGPRPADFLAPAKTLGAGSGGRRRRMSRPRRITRRRHTYKNATAAT